MTGWLVRVAARLVPAGWRANVMRDLEDEGRAGRRGTLWQAWHLARIGAGMRRSMGGDAVAAEIRYALRSLASARWFTLGAILTFALGIGINVAVFSAVDRLLFRHLPYAHPESLVLLKVCDPTSGACGGSFPAPVAYRLALHSDTLTDLAVAGFTESVRLIRGPSDEPPLAFVAVSDRALRALGVAPAVGRDLTDEEIRQRVPAAWISDEAWRGRFGADPSFVGRTLWLRDAPVKVLGILPPGFIPPSGSQTSATWTGVIVEYAGNGWTDVAPSGRVAVPFARLRPDVTLAAAQAEVDAVRRAAEADAARPGAIPEALRVDPMEASLFAIYRPYLSLVAAAAGLVLLMACANLASLFLARSRSRAQVAAIGMALGASSTRLIGAAIVESLLVCAVGFIVAVAALAAAHTVLTSLLPPIFSRYAAALTDGRVVAFSLAATGLCAVVAGALPGWRATRMDVLPLLQRGSRSGHRARVRGGRGLLVVEAALGAMLVLGATVAVRSFVLLTQEDLGFQPDGLYMATVNASAGPRDPVAQAVGMQLKLEAVREMPGVAAAGSADYNPASHEAPVRSFATGVRAGSRVQVSSGYFDALETRILAGRTFTDSEVATQAAVAMMDRLGARLVWPGLDLNQVVGQVWRPAGESPRTIVGVVESIKPDHGGGSFTERRPTAYLPMGAQPTLLSTMAIRMQPGRVLRLPALRTVLESRVPGAGVSRLTSASDALDPALSDPRFRAALLSVFAVTALLLAAIGLYAVASYDATMRRHEMGVRLTLGARPGDLRRLVVRETCWPVLVGAFAGLIGAWWMASLAQSFLYRTDGHDPVLYALVGILLVATAAVAAWGPARRASRIDPAVVLRAH